MAVLRLPGGRGMITDDDYQVLRAGTRLVWNF